MISDKEIRAKGMEALIGALGQVEASRFIALILREPSDYTKWRHRLFDGLSVEEINEQATQHWKDRQKKEKIS